MPISYHSRTPSFTHTHYPSIPRFQPTSSQHHTSHLTSHLTSQHTSYHTPHHTPHTTHHTPHHTTPHITPHTTPLTTPHTTHHNDIPMTHIHADDIPMRVLLTMKPSRVGESSKPNSGTMNKSAPPMTPVSYLVWSMVLCDVRCVVWSMVLCVV